VSKNAARSFGEGVKFLLEKYPKDHGCDEAADQRAGNNEPK
jgi:hypothetical protein